MDIELSRAVQRLQQAQARAEAAGAPIRASIASDWLSLTVEHGGEPRSGQTETVPLAQIFTDDVDRLDLALTRLERFAGQAG